MKIAACFSNSSVDCRNAVASMARSMSLTDDQLAEVTVVSGGAIGYVTGTELFSAIPLQRKNKHGNILLLSGVPIYLDGCLNTKLDEVLSGDYHHAARELQSLDGAFVALFWDAENNTLVIVNDCLGIQPHYIFSNNDVVVLATELKAFPASGFVDVELDTVGWGAFVSLGFNIGDHTQLAGVRLVDAATVMVIDAKTGSIDANQYWSLPKPRPEMTLEDVDIPEMLRILQREIECYAEHSRQGTVLLSGGFDSRLILTLLKRLNIDCKAMTLEHPEFGFGIDGKIALRIAEKLNCHDVSRVYPAKNYYSSPEYLRYLVMEEVSIPSMLLYMSTNVSAALKPEMKAVWEGLGPGFAFAASYPVAGGFTPYLKDRCNDRDSLHWQAVFSIFSPAIGQKMYEDFQQKLTSEMGKFTDDDFGTARFQMNTQMRRYLAPSPTTVYTNTVLPFTPGLSKDLWNLAGEIPLSVTADMKLYLHLYKHYLPEAITVPICSGGKLLSRKSFSPELWLREHYNSLGHKCRYYWHRLPRVPVAGPLLEKWGLVSPSTREHNAMLDMVVSMVSPDHPDLNSDAVRTLQQAVAPYSWETRLARRMLFYWQTWRWVMEGTLTTSNAETFLTQNISREDVGN